MPIGCEPDYKKKKKDVVLVKFFIGKIVEKIHEILP